MPCGQLARREAQTGRVGSSRHQAVGDRAGCVLRQSWLTRKAGGGVRPPPDPARSWLPRAGRSATVLPMSHRFALAALCLGLAGCHLVDQRDFNTAAGRAPAPRAAPPAPQPPPSLVTIRYATPDPQYRDAVAALVERALARKHDVLFTVTTLVPASGTGDAQAAEAAQAAGSGREVAQAIVDDGAEPGQVEQMLRADVGVHVKEVRVDVK